MKTRKWLSYFPTAMLTVLCLGSCQDWGEMDPPSGNQVYPRLEVKGEYKFEEDLNPEEIMLFAYDGGKEPTLVKDREKGKVLHLNGGYARYNSPLNGVKLQTGLSITLWVKTAAENLEGAIFSFANEDNSKRLFLTPNAWLRYENGETMVEENNPATPTNALSPNEWHYLAMSIKNDGFSIYIDGELKFDKVTEKGDNSFDYSQLVQNLKDLPYLYIGYGSGVEPKEMWVDDIKVYRNVITAKESAKPEMGGGDNSFITVGETDCSTAWWTAFSQVLSAEGDCTLHFNFINHTSAIENWHNWLVVLTNGKAFGEEGYAEYLVLRSDNFGWGNCFNAGGLSCDFNFDTFKTDMQGATVDLTIKRTAAHLDITAKITKAAGGMMNYSYSFDGIPTTTLGAFLTVEKGCLEIDRQKVNVGKLYKEGSYRVGAEDCSTPFWSAFSQAITTEKDGITNIQFKNHTSGANNWNNWVLVFTNNKERGAEGYKEYVVLRADPFGWGDYYQAENFKHTYNLETFRTDMENALVNLTVKRIDTRMDMIATITKADGGTMEYSYFHEEFPTEPMNIFFTVDGSYMDILSVSTSPWINSK